MLLKRSSILCLSIHDAPLQIHHSFTVRASSSSRVSLVVHSLLMRRCQGLQTPPHPPTQHPAWTLGSNHHFVILFVGHKCVRFLTVTLNAMILSYFCCYYLIRFNALHFSVQYSTGETAEITQSTRCTLLGSGPYLLILHRNMRRSECRTHGTKRCMYLIYENFIYGQSQRAKQQVLINAAGKNNRYCHVPSTVAPKGIHTP